MAQFAVTCGLWRRLLSEDRLLLRLGRQHTLPAGKPVLVLYIPLLGSLHANAALQQVH